MVFKLLVKSLQALGQVFDQYLARGHKEASWDPDVPLHRVDPGSSPLLCSSKFLVLDDLITKEKKPEIQ